MSNTGDFVIQDGVLVRYTGAGGIVNVPEGVIGISSEVFAYRPVVEVTLPDTLQWLADGAFRSCGRLRRLVLPGSLKVIPESLCEDCEALTELVLSEGIRYISSDAFRHCALSSLTIPDSVRVMDSSCFASCGRLTELSLGEGLRRIGNHAFENCSALRAVRFSPSLREIEGWAFAYCVNLESVSIPQGLEALGPFAFFECNSLREVSLPETLELAAESSFSDCGNLERIIFQGQRTAFRSGNLEVTMPSLTVIRAPYLLPDWLPALFRPAASAGFQEMLAEGRPLSHAVRQAWEAYGRGAFPASPAVRPAEAFHIVDGVLCGIACPEGNIVVPEGVVGIRAEAFQETNVREVHLPDSVKWLQAGAFRDCGQLKAVRLPDGLTHIPEELFLNCRALRSIQIPTSVRHIEDDAFHGCGLESLSLPSSLETVGISAFKKCPQLREVRLPEGVTELRSFAFQECDSLRQVTMPDSLELLGTGVFLYCEALEEARIGKGMAELNSWVFQGCRRLRGLNLPSEIRVLDANAFLELEDGFLLRVEAPVPTIDVTLDETGKPDPWDFLEDSDPFDAPNQARTLRLIAPNADPSSLNGILMLSLLRGFSIAEDEEFRHEAEYLELLSEYKRTFWDEPDILRGLMRYDLLEREDLSPCLDMVYQSGKPELVAEVLDYFHRRFPDPMPLDLDLDADPES